MSNKINILFQNHYFLAFLAGAISALCLAPFEFFIAGIIGFSAFLTILNLETANKKSFWLGWFFGFGHFLFSLYWIAISLFVDIASFWWLVPFAVLLIPSLAAIYIGLVALFLNFISAKYSISGWRKIILFTIIWLFFETLRSNFLLPFPWNLLGYSFFSSLSLAQFSSVVGVYGLSFLAVIFYSAPSLFIILNKNKWNFVPKINFDQQNKSFLAIVIILMISIWSWGFYRLQNTNVAIDKNIKFRIIQPNIVQKDKQSGEGRYEVFLKHIQMSQQDNFGGANYIIWPETAMPYVVDFNKGSDALLQMAATIPQDGFLVSGLVRGQVNADGTGLEKAWNSIVSLDDQGEVKDIYDKNILVPFGEYIPLAQFLPFLNTIAGGNVVLGRGNGAKTVNLGKNQPNFSPLVCYEIIFPGYVIDKNNPPQFLLNVTNDAWFGNSSGPYQHFAMAKMRAVENGISVVRSANSGISGLIDPWGHEVKTLPFGQEGVVDVFLVKKLPKTIYHKLGNWPISIICLVLLLLVFFNSWKRKFRKLF